jgi:hypothetical protein
MFPGLSLVHGEPQAMTATVRQHPTQAERRPPMSALETVAVIQAATIATQLWALLLIFMGER